MDRELKLVNHTRNFTVIYVDNRKEVSNEKALMEFLRDCRWYGKLYSWESYETHIEYKTF